MALDILEKITMYAHVDYDNSGRQNKCIKGIPHAG